MSRQDDITYTIDGDEILQFVGWLKNSGSIEIYDTAGTADGFGGGTLTFFTSLREKPAAFPPAYKDLSGVAYSTTAPDRFDFDEPNVDGIGLYVTVASSTTPTIGIIIRQKTVL